jgi:hypothetical protein
MHGEFIYRNILFFSFKKDVACVHDKMNFFYFFFSLVKNIKLSFNFVLFCFYFLIDIYFIDFF